jgi:hypothetical protein
MRATVLDLAQVFQIFVAEWDGTIDQIEETDYELTVDAGGRSIGQR